jgi:hypothetical protein
MVLDYLIDLLKTYRDSFPHRQIEVRGEMVLDIQLPSASNIDNITPVKLDLGPVSETPRT